jgi:hypothetical protein
VFLNRLSALLFATVVLAVGVNRPLHPHAPAVRYAAASMSNIGSTWAQYEVSRSVGGRVMGMGWDGMCVMGCDVMMACHVMWCDDVM